MNGFAKRVSFTEKLLIVLFLISVLTVCPAVAVEIPVAAPEGEEESHERTSTLDAQRNISDQRTSIWGGTGLVFTRTAIVLPRKQLGAGGYFIFSHYGPLQGTGSRSVQDPRKSDMEFNLVANYGATPYLEIGAFINTFLQNEGPDSFNMRKAGLGWSGLDAKFRLMDLYKNNFGLAATTYLRLPSPQNDANITSKKMGYGIELNASLKMVLIADFLEKFALHGNLGFGHFDYFDTHQATNFMNLQALNPAIDYTMNNSWICADQYTGSLSAEFKPYRGVNLGLEFVGYRMVDRHDDNIQVAPYVTYTFVEIPFMKKVHKDMLTVSLAGNFGIPDERSAPQYGVIAGLTYHASMKF